MKTIFSLLCTWYLLCCHFCCWGQNPVYQSPTIHWFTNYEEAMQQAREQSKPLLLFFTGTGWCPYCTKLENEVLHTREFAETSGNQFIFLLLDFPQNKMASQNRQLLQKFDVRTFPSIILFDAQQQRQIGITGYRPGGPRQYAQHLNNMVNNYSMYNQKIQQMNQQQLSGAELKQLYEKAKELSLDNDVPLIIKSGITSDLKNFFLLEQYRLLADEGMVKSKQAIALKQQLLAMDPENKNKIHYEIAVIDFEAYAENDLTHAVEPLIEYVEKYGKEDKENLWRLQMIISQVFLDQHQLARALNFAQSSYNAAPSTIRPDIAVVIKNIQAQITH